MGEAALVRWWDGSFLAFQSQNCLELRLIHVLFVAREMLSPPRSGEWLHLSAIADTLKTSRNA